MAWIRRFSGWRRLMAADGVLGWRDELDVLKQRLGPLFVRPEPRRQAGLYLEALLSGAQRKNGWQLAGQIGDAGAWGTQRGVSHVHWGQDAARDIGRDYVIEHLGSPDGVLVVDETGFLKKGTHAAGVAPQYSGTAGRVENCQIGVFLAYASRKGHALIDRALDAGVPCAWVLGDEVYGSDHKLRAALEQREQAFVLTVRSNEKLWAVRVNKTGWYTAAELAAARPASAWQCHSAGAGTKGERFYDWARLRLARRPGPVQPHWQHWLLIRRNRTDPDDVTYSVVFAPVNTSLATLARVAGMRWTVEECFEVAKQAVGLDDYEVRSWQGWYRHITLAMLALAFLVAMRVKLNASPPSTGNGAPSRPMVDLSVCEIRHLISRLLLVVGLALEPIFAWSVWRRMHQAIARLCHWKARSLCPA